MEGEMRAALHREQKTAKVALAVPK
jgi:hypothetical protein